MTRCLNISWHNNRGESRSELKFWLCAVWTCRGLQLKGKRGLLCPVTHVFKLKNEEGGLERVGSPHMPSFTLCAAPRGPSGLGGHRGRF